MMLKEMNSSTVEKFYGLLEGNKWLNDQGEKICWKAFMFHVISSLRRQGYARTALILRYLFFPQFHMVVSILKQKLGLEALTVLRCTVLLLRVERLRLLLKLQRSDLSQSFLVERLRVEGAFKSEIMWGKKMDMVVGKFVLNEVGIHFLACVR